MTDDRDVLITEKTGAVVEWWLESTESGKRVTLHCAYQRFARADLNALVLLLNDLIEHLPE